MKDFHVKKTRAQRTLKNLLHEGAFFTGSNLVREGINLIKNKKPQEYFPSRIKAEILENLKKKKM